MKTHITVVALIGFWVVYATAGPKGDFELFRSGEKFVWDSTGHEKAKGIRMKISYPRTWRAVEVSQSNVVQTFTCDSGREMAAVMILTRLLPEPYDRELTESEKQEFVSRDVAKEFVTEPGRFVSHQVTKIDGEVCAMIESEFVTERGGLKIGQKVLTFLLPRKGVLLSIQCAVGGDASTGFAAINKFYEEVKPLFLLISYSCVLTEK
jgi:hypothetical protein